MNTNAMTENETRIIEFLSVRESVAATHLKVYGLNTRAANQLVSRRVLSLTNGVYRLRVQPSAPALDEGVARDPVVEAVVAALAHVGPAEQCEAPEPTSASVPTTEPSASESATVSAAVDEEVVYSEPPPTDPAPPVEVVFGDAAAPKGGRAGKSTARGSGERRAGKPSKPAKAKVAPPAVNPAGLCLCGCGATVDTRRRFLIGHDAKLHSLVLRAHRGKADKNDIPAMDPTRNYLQTAPWMTDELRDFLGI
ncbi:hypothetical protein [Chondromyces crocatus]|uniref:Uncharacterized protein n=1 Tax=Chondromyces crocatus TaxID=52 RepID=A0A0K1EBK9_CHOCO|nr:hypothetical protein [Chondromyces crocatus]AKT38271.1 uncharacterized protein CMC5_024140 [Chondromyces crocatus]